MNEGFVSRAGEKLSYALKFFNISVKDLICADFGSSTGGFVECLLREGARIVYSVDTSYGQLSYKLRNDKRVVVMERTNALHVTLPEHVDFISIDVSWTKQEKILPNTIKNLKIGGSVISLLKPHYEANWDLIRKGVLGDEDQEEVLKKTILKIKNVEGIRLNSYTISPIQGKRGGNKEYLLFLSKV
ncbi:hypothetical protein A2716_03365 [candidate division WWE3 bacterium RIFCSPHIGHO2_01_FULL_40_23]|uniref:Ribosomal RNA methyltransferase FtsJ domain-containing protein n=1 Tax=candidate division WWE3 bacterium RIFCSPLOWO2_01_FULL_41_18 TaxID=1802625 RepID=A0A1F4VCR9_UNCKA|nr:MAG: hypothetical protein A2716_03365 [candidate division WWE3 bacterium RIFCSPHIGHO2_01_FULL_40_23]OGC54919.1 MAG: hypothetical protein A3A78_02975 [candidate division WWE3 bacterium RIFCSPLOWO2_01_FULL_41_18]